MKPFPNIKAISTAGSHFKVFQVNKTAVILQKVSNALPPAKLLLYDPQIGRLKLKPSVCEKKKSPTKNKPISFLEGRNVG